MNLNIPKTHFRIPEKNLRFEVEQNQKRLKYYSQLKQKITDSDIVDKWIQIYSERLEKLETQAQHLGLKMQFQSASTLTPFVSPSVF